MPIQFISAKTIVRQLKQIGLLIPFILYCTFAVGQQQDTTVFRVSGRIKNFGTGILIGTIRAFGNDSIRLDTIEVKHDSLNHTTCVEAPQVIKYEPIDDRFARYRKVIKNGDSVAVDFADGQLKCMEVVAAPGLNITINGTAGRSLTAYPSGSAENEQLAALRKKFYPLIDQLSDLDYSDRKIRDSVLKAEDRLTTAATAIQSDFVKNNPSSIVSSFLIWKQFELLNKKNPDKADSLFQLIHPIDKDIYKQLMLLAQQNRNKTITELSVGQLFPDFKTKFVYKNSSFNLKQTLGKYTLIDFWGTWCIPCVKELPKLKSYCDKFSHKLNLVSIASDDYVRWKAFLDKKNYNWVQILDQDIPKLSERFVVQVYPTKYLLDPEGKILMIFKDVTEEVWEQLDHLLMP
ncbi:TlpA family protein disulfide reductase [Niabella soli]|uniref:Thioredoxin domain-containing protein n=1 Tax=Niabella soli DSM 19437 TaxID=929713 RepID=W0F8Q0_9BACT|nr:TlpA disulfide reductase family protein [Niabella soli]AHF17736.1 hypothetical protein NIASO_13340 [Niabella soli DSM 19437]